MRLQYAKLKVEHGWQRQNLNEVENLYFHHSQVRGLRPVVPVKTVPLLSTNSLPPTAPAPEPPAPMAVDEISQQVVNSQASPTDNSRGLTSPHDSPVELAPTPVQNPFTNNTSKSVTLPLHTMQTLPEKTPSQEPSQPAPAPVHPSTQSDTASQEPPNSATVAPPYSPLDFSDPATMVRFTQMQMQSQPQLQSQAPSHNQTPTLIQTHAQSQPYNPYMPLNRQSSHPQPNPFMPQPLPQYSFTQSYHATSLQNQSNPQVSHSQPSTNSQSPFGNGNGSSPLTYDSFWSTHASAGSLYRTHGGFTASATPTGHVAMITPGGHAAVMTAEGVYVGAAGYTGRVSG
ncbi:hypothetical protein DEU56DRAFT_914554 [Suillus clintonianus]|uniref:uncharacterized protein n=1 Tax=Suillus clintonianus TaxID=1904413 RepID=UPI001B88648F|nr:uncharacterized protein DEU56DRAFT_914554 [Suillus clintonianus]KAG2131019.1 hypothetical protein DEU56DRAFT_914554 [Suillus clintonianus]